MGHTLSQTRHDFQLTWAFHLDVEKLCIASAKEFVKGKKSFRLYYMYMANISVSERASKQKQTLIIRYKHCHQVAKQRACHKPKETGRSEEIDAKLFVCNLITDQLHTILKQF